MKIRHNKFRNTGILFELLVRQIASDTVSGKDSASIDIVKKYFSKTELAKEHKIYQALVNTKTLTEGKAESLINATLEISSRLNKSALRKEKYNLIKEINDASAEFRMAMGMSKETTKDIYDDAQKLTINLMKYYSLLPSKD